MLTRLSISLLLALTSTSALSISPIPDHDPSLPDSPGILLNSNISPNANPNHLPLRPIRRSSSPPAPAPLPAPASGLGNNPVNYKLKQATRSSVLRSLTRNTPENLAKRARARSRALNSAVPAPMSVVYDGTVYTLFHTGFGYIETDDNPSNTANDRSLGYYPRDLSLPGSTSQLSAIQSCAAFAREPDYYYAFQIYFNGDEDEWVCRTYYHLGEGGPADSDSSYFNVKKEEAVVVYGYQVEA